MQLQALASKSSKGENVENRQALLPVTVGKSGQPRPRVFSAMSKNTCKMAVDMGLPTNISYKQLHERFVSDLNGTSLFEINAVTSSAQAAVLLRTVLFNVLFSKEEKFSKSFFCW